MDGEYTNVAHRAYSNALLRGIGARLIILTRTERYLTAPPNQFQHWVKVASDE